MPRRSTLSSSSLQLFGLSARRAPHDSAVGRDFDKTAAAKTTERNPYVPPQAEVCDAPAAWPTERTLATRTLRLAGAIVDSVASAVFVVPLYIPIAFALIDSALIFRRDRRCAHDLIAGTRVVAVAR